VPARVQDYLLGGRDNFAADRGLAGRLLRADPDAAAALASSRAFGARAACYLARDEGVRQFLVIGTGYPGDGNIHEVVQQAAPGCTVVYADSDPVVMAHAMARLTPAVAGGCGYVEADLRDPELILAGAARTLDLSQPVAVLLVGILHFISDGDDPGHIIARLMDGVPVGSFLVISHFTMDFNPRLAFFSQHDVLAPGRAVLRTRQQVLRLFTGLKLLAPGLVPTSRWRPGTDREASAHSVAWAGVARTTGPVAVAAV
jgi:S-adenosyl methyltransferase